MKVTQIHSSQCRLLVCSFSLNGLMLRSPRALKIARVRPPLLISLVALTPFNVCSRRDNLHLKRWFRVPFPTWTIPDDVTVPQFFLDSYHPNRPSSHHPSSSYHPRPDVGLGKDRRKWIVDDRTGRGFTHDQVRHKGLPLANIAADL